MTHVTKREWVSPGTLYLAEKPNQVCNKVASS